MAHGWRSRHDVHDLDRPIHALGDSGYGGKSVTRNLPANPSAISRLTMNAALYDLAPSRRPGQEGCPRKKGERLPSPKRMCWLQQHGTEDYR